MVDYQLMSSIFFITRDPYFSVFSVVSCVPFAEWRLTVVGWSSPPPRRTVRFAWMALKPTIIRWMWLWNSFCWLVDLELFGGCLTFTTSHLRIHCCQSQKIRHHLVSIIQQPWWDNLPPFVVHKGAAPAPTTFFWVILDISRHVDQHACFVRS